jgi:hypothetical protein
MTATVDYVTGTAVPGLDFVDAFPHNLVCNAAT